MNNDSYSSYNYSKVQEEKGLALVNYTVANLTL